MAGNQQIERKVFEATNQLLADREYRDVTVSMILDASGVSRTTFYRHFKDKDDIVQKYVADIAEDTLWAIGRTCTWREGVIRNIYGLMKYKNLVIKSAKERGYNSYYEYSIRMRYENMIETLTNYKHVEIDNALRYQVEAAAVSGPSIMNRYIRNGMVEPPEQFVDDFITAMPQRLFSILNKPV